MSTEYSGLPAVARRFWHNYSVAFAAAVSLLFFSGGFAALVVLTIIPEAWWFFVIAAGSFSLHFAGLFVNDVWSGEWNPNQTTFSSATELIAMVIVVGAFLSSLLLIGTYLAYLVDYIGGSIAVTALVAAYIPVADILLIRRGHYTPGALVLIGSVLLINTVVNIHKSVIEVLPVIGNRERPHS